MFLLIIGNSLLTERQRSIVRQLDSIHKDMNRIYDTGQQQQQQQSGDKYKDSESLVYGQSNKDRDPYYRYSFCNLSSIHPPPPKSEPFFPASSLGSGISSKRLRLLLWVRQRSGVLSEWALDLTANLNLQDEIPLPILLLPYIYTTHLPTYSKRICCSSILHVSSVNMTMVGGELPQNPWVIKMQTFRFCHVFQLYTERTKNTTRWSGEPVLDRWQRFAKRTC